jgi:hypothetical protein
MLAYKGCLPSLFLLSNTQIKTQYTKNGFPEFDVFPFSSKRKSSWIYSCNYSISKKCLGSILCCFVVIKRPSRAINAVSQGTRTLVEILSRQPHVWVLFAIDSDALVAGIKCHLQSFLFFSPPLNLLL